MRLLVVEDDDVLRTSVTRVLVGRGYAVDAATTLAAADERLRVHDYDGVILDRMLPDGDSVSALAQWRSDQVAAPTILLTALGDVADRVAGLDAGADDYLVKPFAMDELMARVRSLVRRGPQSGAPTLSLGDLVVDPASWTAHRGGRELVLTAKEFALLEYLVRHRDRAIARTELIEHCWDEFADPVSNIVDVRVGLLRTKLGDPPLVHTVRGVGYVARAEP